jgi:hypothetical protein
MSKAYRTRRFFFLVLFLTLVHAFVAGMLMGYVSMQSHDIYEGGTAPPGFAVVDVIATILAQPFLAFRYVLGGRSYFLPAAMLLWLFSAAVWGLAWASLWEKAARGRFPWQEPEDHA